MATPSKNIEQRSHENPGMLKRVRDVEAKVAEGDPALLHGIALQDLRVLTLRDPSWASEIGPQLKAALEKCEATGQKLEFSDLASAAWEKEMGSLSLYGLSVPVPNDVVAEIPDNVMQRNAIQGVLEDKKLSMESFEGSLQKDIAAMTAAVDVARRDFATPVAAEGDESSSAAETPLSRLEEALSDAQEVLAILREGSSRMTAEGFAKDTDDLSRFKLSFPDDKKPKMIFVPGFCAQDEDGKLSSHPSLMLTRGQTCDFEKGSALWEKALRSDYESLRSKIIKDCKEIWSDCITQLTDPERVKSLIASVGNNQSLSERAVPDTPSQTSTADM